MVAHSKVFSTVWKRSVVAAISLKILEIWSISNNQWVELRCNVLKTTSFVILGTLLALFPFNRICSKHNNYNLISVKMTLCFSGLVMCFACSTGEKKKTHLPYSHKRFCVEWLKLNTWPVTNHTVDTLNHIFTTLTNTKGNE